MSEEGEGSSSSGRRNPYSLITEDHVKAALMADQGCYACLLSWTVKDFCQKGDNIATVVTCVEVEYTKDSATHQRSYIVKLNPCRYGGTPEELNSMFFEKEISFYTQIVPDLISILTSGGHEPLRVPKFLHSSREPLNELIFLEDLRPKGFKMIDRTKGLDEAHVRLVLGELARLHAASVLLQAKTPNQHFTEIYTALQKDLFTCSEENKDKINCMLSSIYNNASDILKMFKGYEKVVSWIEDPNQKIIDKLQEQIITVPPFKVICHGDCWNNNLLFRYDTAGTPVEVMLVDAQMTRVSSPAIDLITLLYDSVCGDTRRAHMDTFIASYHASFSAIVESSGVQMPFNLSEFRQEFRKRMKHGLINCFVTLPYLLIGSETHNVEDILGENSKEQLKNWRQELMQNIHDNTLLQERLLATIDDMMEAGHFS